MAHVEAIQQAKELLAQYNHYAAIRELLADQQAWQNLKDHNGRIFAALEAVLATERSRIYPTRLYDNVFSVLVFFTRCWPRNEYNHPEGQPRSYQCVYTLEPIAHPVYTSTGLIVEAENLPEIVKYGKNPLNRQLFNQRDIDYMKLQAAHYKIDIPKTRREKFIWQDVFLSTLLTSTVILIVIAAFAIVPLLTGLLPLTLLAGPVFTAPLSYAFTNFWFKRSRAKNTAGFSDKIAGLIALSNDAEVDQVIPALPHEVEQAAPAEEIPEFEIDQPGLPRVVGEADHPELVIALGEPDHPELPPELAQPQRNVVAVNANSNKRQAMLSWLNKIEPSLHKEPALDEQQPGLSVKKR